MTLLEMWQEVRRRWVLVALVLVTAALAGLFVAYRPGLPPESRQYQVWSASADILVDTSDSQVFDSRSPDFLTLGSRASLLGNLIETGRLKNAIAATAGVAADRLVVVPPATATAPGVAPTPVTPVSREIPDAEATVLTLTTLTPSTTGDATLPILHVSAQAPDAVTAGRLAGGTIGELERHLDSVAARQEIPAARKLVLRQLAAPIPAPETRGPHWLLGLATAIVLALLGCATIVGAPMLARRWRQAEAAASRSGRTAIDHEPPVPFDRAARLGQAGGDGVELYDGAEPAEDAELEEGAELAGAAVAAPPGSGAMAEGTWQPTRPKKQSRRRRKHGKPRR